MGKYDMILLEEPEFEEEKWGDENDRVCAYPAARVYIGVNSSLLDTAPEIVDFLSQYATMLDENNDILAYLDDHDGDAKTAAVYFLQTYPEVWREWVPEEVATRIQVALEN